MYIIFLCICARGKFTIGMDLTVRFSMAKTNNKYEGHDDDGGDDC